MSKADFIETVAQQGNVPYAQAKRAVELVFAAVETGLKANRGGGKLKIGTFGTFTITRRKARIGRNPKTGEAIKIKAARSLRFKPALQLKEAAGC